MGVLIIEDDQGVRESIAAILREEGYDVAEAASGAAALRQFARGRRPSLILLDLMMPEIDGIDFRRRQLADPALRAIPV